MYQIIERIFEVIPLAEVVSDGEDYLIYSMSNGTFYRIFVTQRGEDRVNLNIISVSFYGPEKTIFDGCLPTELAIQLTKELVI